MSKDNQQPTSGRRTFLKSTGAIAAGLLTQAAVPVAQAETPSAPTLAGSHNSMPTRNLGRTGHKVGIFSLGGQGALELPNNEAVAVPIIERALDLGVNYCDTSSIYGGPDRWSEQYFGKVMKRRRSETFLATKTKERTRDASMRMIERSLQLLNTDHVDLWQLHDIGTLEDVNQCFAKGGAMEALIECKEQSIVKNLGITGHHRPASLIECIHRYPFDAVLMALNAADSHQHALPTSCFRSRSKSRWHHRYVGASPRPHPRLVGTPARRAAAAHLGGRGHHLDQARNPQDAEGDVLDPLAARQHRHYRLRHHPAA